VEDCKYISELKQSEKFYKKEYPLKFPHYYAFTIKQVRVDGLWLEFGVWTGTSAKIITYLMQAFDHDKKLYGFDSFEGLPEDWQDPITGEIQKEGKKGFFSLNGFVPNPPNENVVFVKGWFDKTLPKFAKDNEGPLALLHIDCDLYSSTKTVFDNLEDRIVPGTVIMFDEIHGYPGYQAHELKAFQELVEKTNIKYKWIGHVVDGRQASLIVTSR